MNRHWRTLMALMAFLGCIVASAPAGEPALIPSEGVTRPHWVFFADKGPTVSANLNSAAASPTILLSERSLRRRAKVRPQGSLLDAKDLPVPARYVDAVTNLATRRRIVSRWLNAVSVEATQEQIRLIEALPFVREVKPVARGRRGDEGPVEPPPDTPSTSTTGPFGYGPSAPQANLVNLPAVHTLGFSGKDVLICVLDTGFELDRHEALLDLDVAGQWDFVANSPSAQGPGTAAYHGTGVLSICGGSKDNRIIGPAYGASYLLARTEDYASEYPQEEDFWQAGVEWADSAGADIITSSVAYTQWYDYEDLDGNTAVTTIAADWAAANGIVVCNCMGNYGPSAGSLAAPADADSIVAIGMVDANGAIAYGSSRGPTYDGRIKPEVVALGSGAFSAKFGTANAYEYVYGTSYSAPMIAGIAALVLEMHPAWTPMQVRNALMMTADRATAPNNDYGWGIVDAHQAVFYRCIAGLITDITTGQPIAAAQVACSGASSAVAQADADGRYVLENLNAGTHTLSVSAAGFTAATSTVQVPPWIGDTHFALMPAGTQAPVLQLVEFSLDDDGQGASCGDGDGVPDVNEVIEIDLTVRNTGTAVASNVTVRAVSSSPVVVVRDSVATLGSLGTGQSMAVQGALVVAVSPDAYHGQAILITLTMSADGGYSASAEIPLTLSASMPHWPRSFGAMVSAPKALDLDGDGDREIMFGDGNGLIHVVHHDGTPFAGWPVSVGAGVSAVGTPVVGDMDGDGQPEIVATTATGIYAWKRDGRPVPGWPFAIGLSSNSLLRLSTMMEDLNNDGHQEVVVTATFGQISVLSNTGAKLASMSAGDSIFCSPALADLDGDGDLEIVVASGPPTGASGSVMAWHHDGSPVQGAWPVSTEGLPQGGISAADLDGDGADEIVVPAGTLGASPSGTLYVLKGDGLHYPGWPKSLAPMIVCQPSIGDLNGDGQLDIVIPVRDSPSTSQIHALSRGGASLPGWPVAVLAKVSYISPALADLDSDRMLDVAVTTETGAVHAWDRMGAPLAGFPFEVEPTFAFTGVPTLDDLDLDGDIELVAASLEGMVHAWDLPGAYNPSMIAWAMSRHDHGNTSNIRLRGADSGPHEARPSALTLSWPVPNPSTGETEIRFTLPTPARVTLQICDVSGKRICLLMAGERLSTGTHRIRWHGLNDAGLRVPSGLYMVRLEAAGMIQTRPVVLVRR